MDGPHAGKSMDCDDDQHVVRLSNRVIVAGQHHGMTEVCTYAIDDDDLAFMTDHSFHGDPSCVACGRCRRLDIYGRCCQCVEVRHEDDPSIIRKDRPTR